jgi:hypothetical protein
MEENNMRPTKRPGIYCFDQCGFGLECFFIKNRNKPARALITATYAHPELPSLNG